MFISRFVNNFTSLISRDPLRHKFAIETIFESSISRHRISEEHTRLHYKKLSTQGRMIFERRFCSALLLVCGVSAFAAEEFDSDHLQVGTDQDRDVNVTIRKIFLMF